MTTETRERIVITKEELLDPKIDDRLSQQRATGPGTLQPLHDKSEFRLLYTTWFYLLLAGLFGALAGWAIIEPFFEDGLVFTGRVQQVASDDVAPNLRRIVVSEVPVIVVTNKTTIRGGERNQINYIVDDLRVDSVVKLRGELIEKTKGVVAEAIRILPPGTAAPSKVDVEDLHVSQTIAGIALFPVVAGMIGLVVGAVEGVICRTLARAMRSGFYGLVAGVAGGFIAILVGGMVYELLGGLVKDPTASAGALTLQMFRRGLAWMIAGSAMGLGQGWALKSRRLLLNGFIGGILGGLIGGLVFDPTTLIFWNRAMFTGAGLSRAVGFGIIGTTVGVMIGITDVLTRSAWLKVVAGPLRGKEFNFYQTPIRLGSSPKNEIYLFKDPKIDPIHAIIHQLRDTYEITDNGSASGTVINGQRIKRKRLTHGDKIQIGESEFLYTMRDNKKKPA